MKKLLLLLFVLTSAACAQQAAPPKDVPCDSCKPIKKAEDQERFSRLWLKAQKTAESLRAAQQQAENYLASYVRENSEAYQAYLAELTRLQEEHEAKGCQLTVDKQWVNCPKPAVK